MSGILTGKEIRKSIEEGDITVSPFEPGNINYEDRINPGSYDLTLGRQIAVYEAVTVPDFSCRGFDPSTGRTGIPGSRVKPRESSHDDPEEGLCYLDAAQPNKISKFTMDDRGFLLKPGIGYLGHTVEKICTTKYIPILDGKSSTGRLFCWCHVTAGYGDLGFDGQYTLEIVVVQPLVVYPGMRFCQIRFHSTLGEPMNYSDKGNYVGAEAEGPVASRSWKQFRK